MSVTHRCQFCDGDYACDTFEQGENEHGHAVSRCQCQAVDSCPGCSEHGACEQCGKAPATGDGHQPFYCGPCEEKWLDNYDGPEPDYDPVTIQELSDRAYRERETSRA